MEGLGDGNLGSTRDSQARFLGRPSSARFTQDNSNRVAAQYKRKMNNVFGIKFRTKGTVTRFLSTFALGTAILGIVAAGNLAPSALGNRSTFINAENAANAVVARVGSRGATVVAIQRKVGATADGAYGARTATAVRAWQSRNRLPATGVVDSVTYKRMFPPAPARAAVATTYRTGTQIIGYSVQGRSISMTVLGNPAATKRVMFIAAIHGNEKGGVGITRGLATVNPPAGVAYFIIHSPNSDGYAANTRQNARKVDLNRNFPGWRPNGRPGYVYYPGAGALSEPESRYMYNVINKVKPTLFVTYHQAMNVVDFGGGNNAAEAIYARKTGMKFVQLTRYPGSQATWTHAAYPKTTVMTVELPASVPASMVSRHIAAARYIAAHH